MNAPPVLPALEAYGVQNFAVLRLESGDYRPYVSLKVLEAILDAANLCLAGVAVHLAGEAAVAAVLDAKWAVV